MRYTPEPPYHRWRIATALAALLVVLGAGGTASAQGSWLLGPVVGYEFGTPLAIARGGGGVNGIAAPGLGSSYNNMLRAGANVVFGGESQFDVRLSYAYSRGVFRSAPQDSDRVFDPITQTVTPLRYRVDMTTAASMVDVEARYLIPLSDRWVFGAGIWGSGRLTTQFAATRRELGPFPLGGGAADSTLQVPDTRGAEPLRFGVIPAIAFKVPLSATCELRPELAAPVDLRALFLEGLDLRAVSARASVSVLFGLSASPADTVTPPRPPDTTTIADRDSATRRSDSALRARADSAALARSDTARGDTVRKPLLTATVDLVSLGGGGAAEQTAIVASELVEHAITMPMPAAVYFDRGSAEVPSRYHLLDRTEAARFSIDSLARSRPLDVVLRMLDILGMRLRSNPSAAVTLIGCSASDEPATLAAQRAAAIREYLTGVWGIAAVRIAVAAEERHGSSSDERVVRIASTTTALTSPVVVRWRARSYQLPPLDIRPAIRSEAGVLRWDITVRHGDRTIIAYGSNNPAGTNNISLYLPDDPGGGAPPPLVAELDVADSAGQTYTVRDTLPLRFAGRSPRQQDGVVDRERSTFIVPSAMASVGWHLVRPRTQLQTLSAGLRTGDRVTVAGPDAGRIARDLRVAEGGRRGIDWRVSADAAVTADASPESRLLGAAAVVIVERGELGTKP